MYHQTIVTGFDSFAMYLPGQKYESYRNRKRLDMALFAIEYQTWSNRISQRTRKSWDKGQRPHKGVMCGTRQDTRDLYARFMAQQAVRDATLPGYFSTDIAQHIEWSGLSFEDVIGSLDGLREYAGEFTVDHASIMPMAEIVFRSNYRALAEMIEEANLEGEEEWQPFMLADDSIYVRPYVKVWGEDRQYALTNIAELISGTENYILIDDDLLTEMENDEWEEYLSSCERELVDAIKRQLPELEDYIDDLIDDCGLIEGHDIPGYFAEAKQYNEYGSEIYAPKGQFDKVAETWLENNPLLEIAARSMLAEDAMISMSAEDAMMELQKWVRNRPSAPSIDEPEIFSELYYQGEPA